MTSRRTRLLPALLLALAAPASLGAAVRAPAAPALPAARLAELRAALPARTALAADRLAGARGALGLGADAAFAARHAFVNPQGRTVIRFEQQHQGLRVWGAQAVAHVEPDGAVRLLTAGASPGVAVAGAPLLDAAQARAIVLGAFPAVVGPDEPAAAEQVIFPTRYQRGLLFRFDGALGREVFDPVLSCWARPASQPYVWAWEVRMPLGRTALGPRAWSAIVDATTGAILRKWNDLQSDTAVTSTGHGYYHPEVELDTAQAADGTYALRSMSRGSVRNPALLRYFGVVNPGLTTTYDTYFKDPVLGLTERFVPYAGNPAPSWGDGQLFAGWTFGFSPDARSEFLLGAPDANGQTAAVDAHYGLSTTWDLYRNVFGRLGIDDQDTSTFAMVHWMTGDGKGNVARQDNAFWSSTLFGMIFGDGTWPKNPAGGLSLTEIDITGHELTHGVTHTSAGLLYDGESGGLNEGTSDIFGKMVQAYATRAPGQDAGIPDFAAGDLVAWQLGVLSGQGTPIRWMYKPSLDRYSADGWYDGLGLGDVHFSSGPLNRMFYFLCQGASADPALDTYSPLLPGGMPGIGNERAARIWYKTLTEHLTQDATFASARAAALTAAGELYGPDSAEVLAVSKAFAAVNVGEAPGQPARVRVGFPVVHAAGTPLGGFVTSPPGLLGKVQIFPTRTPVRVTVDVQNTADQAVTWSLPPRADGLSGGVINPDGTWTTPMWTYSSEFLVLEATSHADPLQFAKGRVLVADLDADSDTETDALDLGMVAMAWHVQDTPRPAANVSHTSYMTDEWDLVWFTEGMRNAWPVR